MQNLKLIPLFCMLFIGCGKDQERDEPRCQTHLCSGYLETWEALISERNDLPKSYIQDHFKITDSEIKTFENGEQFVIKYIVSIDWAEIEITNAFMVRISENPDIYPGLHLKRGAYLDKNDIDALISYGNIDSYISEIAQVNHLGFSSANEALDAIRAKAKTQEMYFDYIGYKVTTGGFKANGHPYLFSIGEEDPISKTRLDAEIDLVNKSISTYPTQTENKGSQILNP